MNDKRIRQVQNWKIIIENLREGPHIKICFFIQYARHFMMTLGMSKRKECKDLLIYVSNWWPSWILCLRFQNSTISPLNMRRSSLFKWFQWIKLKNIGGRFCNKCFIFSKRAKMLTIRMLFRTKLWIPPQKSVFFF